MGPPSVEPSAAESVEEARPRRALTDPADFPPPTPGMAALVVTPARRIPAVALVVAVAVVWVIAIVMLLVYGLSWGSAPMEPVPLG